jgi:hypothetical protein
MIDEIYREMVSRGLVTTMRDFSRIWLGRAHNYYTDYTRTSFASDALIHLIKRLNAAGQMDLSARVTAILFADDAAARQRGPVR